MENVIDFTFYTPSSVETYFGKKAAQQKTHFIIFKPVLLFYGKKLKIFYVA